MLLIEQYIVVLPLDLQYVSACFFFFLGFVTKQTDGPALFGKDTVDGLSPCSQYSSSQCKRGRGGRGATSAVLPLMQYLTRFGKIFSRLSSTSQKLFSSSGRREGGGGSTVRRAVFQGIIPLYARRTVENEVERAREGRRDSPKSPPPDTVSRGP